MKFGFHKSIVNRGSENTQELYEKLPFQFTLKTRHRPQANWTL
jgi:hypothetical protein